MREELSIGKAINRAARDLPGEKHQIAAAHGGHVVGDRGGHGRQREAERGEFLLGRGGFGCAGIGEGATGEEQETQGGFHGNFSVGRRNSCRSAILEPKILAP